MIELYLGAPGGGKSYHALCRGLSRIGTINDKFVMANFPIKFSKGKKGERERRRWIYQEDFTPQELMRFSVDKKFYGKEGSALLIIDEAGIKFNSRDWQISGDARKEWIKFFSQSRKWGYDVILVAQFDRMLDRQIRACAEYTVQHRALRNYIWLKWLPWKSFAYVDFWVGGAFAGVVHIDFLIPWKANRYDTMRLFNVNESGVDLVELSKVVNLSSPDLAQFVLGKVKNSYEKP